MPAVTRPPAPSFTDAANSRTPRAAFPFSAIVGHQAAKRALLLLAIEPGLRGALLSSNGGSDESLLARALGDLLDASCHFDLAGGVVDLPLNITEDRLLGELDLERTIATGNREISTGLLARANGRVLFVNDINLLDPRIAVHVAQALDSREARVEREGISATHDADFVLVGLFNSNEGEPNPLLRDRVGLIVESAVDWSHAEKAEIIERAFRFDSDPFRFAEDFASENAELKRDIKDARARLPRVRVSEAQVRQISQIALRLRVEGNRADVFALKAARAAAALAGRGEVSEEDLVAAIELVLVPRATTLPLQRDEEPKEQGESSRPEHAEENARSEVEELDSSSIARSAEDMIIETIDARVPKDLLSPLEQAPRVSREGKRFNASPSTRGRYTRSAIKRRRDVRIAIDATLRAAAPYQLLRRARSEQDGRPSFDRDVLQDKANTAQSRRVKIDPSDLRFKEFKHRSGILFTFAVDASGSMALNRLAQAKGGLIRLLQEAYLHRDKVALISFRGRSSEVLLAPTRSVELARRLVEALPAGGGTPLSAGIVKGIELARLARLRGMMQSMLVLFTDGRANVGLGEDRSSGAAPTIGEELMQLGAVLRSEEVRSVVVDTKSRFISNGEAEAVARKLGARYIYLPGSDAGSVYDAIVSVTRTPGEDRHQDE
ncbi:MAG TPA: magnesium chelatase ATPase subunit D [Blastocatellia bacterium]|nr:magnesium chelatase ATPase subunit D [Blastocatellia bacterium]